MLWNGRYGYYYLGIENQLLENYPMPYRILNYDCLIYKDQIKNLEKQHIKKKDLKNSEEFVSGMKSNDKLIPCITIVTVSYTHLDVYKRQLITTPSIIILL